MVSSRSSIHVMGGRVGSYESDSLVEGVDLSQIQMHVFELTTRRVYDKIFIKKSDYSSDRIVIGNFSLRSPVLKKTLISDESLIKPEYEHVSREGERIVFEDGAPIWSFFSVQFYHL